jgi:hypothetical protein
LPDGVEISDAMGYPGPVVDVIHEEESDDDTSDELAIIDVKEIRVDMGCIPGEDLGGDCNDALVRNTSASTPYTLRLSKPRGMPLSLSLARPFSFKRSKERPRRLFSL